MSDKRLIDVDLTDRDDGKVPVWYDSEGTHVYEPLAGGGISPTLLDAKGDLIAASADNTAAKLTVGANGKALIAASGEATGLKWDWPGAIVQVKTAVSTADDTTTAATMQDSSLSLAFTPLFSDSILHVRVDGECSFTRAAGTIVERYGWVGILNSTNAVELVREARGMTLVATSAVGNSVFAPIALSGFYTVDSLTARTFKLQFMSGAVTNCQAQINGSRTGGIRMTIMEVRP